MSTDGAPRWDLGSIYPGLRSAELASDLAELSETIRSIGGYHDQRLGALGPGADPAEVARALDEAVTLFNRAQLLSSTLVTYADLIVAADSYDTEARKKLSELELVQVELKKAWTRFQLWLGGMRAALPAALRIPGPARDHAFVLQETAEQAAYLMTEPEETLAAELELSGAAAWNKLQRTITSQIMVDFELDGRVQKLPAPALVNLRTHRQESVRRRAYEAEIGQWKSHREELAACMNGVKGASVTLARRRGRADPLEAAVDLARIDRGTLEALLGAMRDSLPMFASYFGAKARRLGKETLAWWDLFAPAGRTGTTFTFAEARELILGNFETFSPELRDLAARAFDRQWIDAEPRGGKTGGAFCESVPGRKESRVLLSFDGTLELVSTLAHELGHAFHDACAFQAGKTPLQMNVPMTLAEMASIMCETIVNNAVRARATDPAEELAILENALINDSQVIVDIYSRFLFEEDVLERRQRSELSADDLCAAMEHAQATAYGPSLDERYRHPYMWAWKPHYYISELDFYNFPSAFGLLFGTGLYALSRKRGRQFIPDFMALLASSGEDTAAGLAARFGIDIRGRAFWDGSMAVIRERVERYCAL